MKKSILVDEKSLQVFGHFEEFYFNAFGQQVVPNPAYKKRLSRFLELIQDDDKREVVVDKISKKSLKGASCLVILTRIKSFSSEEFEAIFDFLRNQKNSLLLMSNHNPFELQDDELTSKLGVSLIGGYWSGVRREYTTIDEECLTDHVIITGKNSERPVTSILTNTTCRIVSGIGTPFVYLPDTMVGRWSSENEAPITNKIFGLVIDGQEESHETIKGKVIVLGDSGFIGDKDSTFPGFGVIEKGDNELFISRMFDYLLD